MFHRLTTPTYFGGLPGGYDYINNALVGTPAFVSPQKVGGVNDGTYFVAYGEDATSADFNRGHGALAENTDILDDMLRRDMAVVVRTTSAGGPATDAILTGPGIYLGGGSSVLKDLFRIVDDNGENIVDPSTGTQCVVDAIDAGGALGSGYSAGSVTVSIDPPVPVSVNFRVVYLLRSNFATADTDVLGVPLRSDVDYNARLWHLQAGGIDARYRRSVSGELGALDVAGSGATYFRDGASMRGYGQVDLTGSTAYNASVGYYLEALWMAENNDFGGHEPTGGENPFGPYTPPVNDRFGGTSSGFVYLGQQRYSQMLAETATHRAPGFASFYHGAKHYDDGVADLEMLTWLPAGTVVDFTASVITVPGPAYFHTAGASAIALGYDLIDLDFGDGVPRSFILNAFLSDTECSLRNLDNSEPDVPAATPATIVRWVKTRFGVFDGAKEAWLGYGDQGNPPYGLAGLVHIAGGPSTQSGNNTLHGSPAQFYGFGGGIALAWGGFNPSTNTMDQLGFLNDDGSILAASVSSLGSVSGKQFQGSGQQLTAGGIARTVNFALGHKVFWDTPSGAGTTLTVTVSTNGVGHGILVIKRGGDLFTTLAVVSPAHAAVRFRGTDSQLGLASAHTVYVFESISTNIGQVLYVYKLGTF